MTQRNLFFLVIYLFSEYHLHQTFNQMSGHVCVAGDRATVKSMVHIMFNFIDKSMVVLSGNLFLFCFCFANKMMHFWNQRESNSYIPRLSLN